MLRRGAVLFAAGAAIGLLAAAATAQVIGTLLYNVPGFDPISFSVATILLCIVALVACGPARRAAAVDPLVALRIDFAPGHSRSTSPTRKSMVFICVMSLHGSNTSDLT